MRSHPLSSQLEATKKKKSAGPEEAEFLLANLMVHNQLILLKIQTPEQQAATPETDQNDRSAESFVKKKTLSCEKITGPD